MRWKKLVLYMLTGMMIASVYHALAQREDVTEARIVQVERGSVVQIIPLEGRVCYADQRYLYAEQTGVVERICAHEGQRLSAGEALLRISCDQYHQEISAYLANEGMLNVQLPDDIYVIRATDDCTLREILVAEEMPVAAGTPVARISSQQQEIICCAVACDANRVAVGMWAWMTFDGDRIGQARVIRMGESEPDEATGLLITEIVLQPEQHLELPEGTAFDIDVYAAGGMDVLSLPMEAITERGTVWWINNGRCTEIPAQIVLTDEMRAWVSLPEGIDVAVGEFTEGQCIVEAQP